MNGGHQKTPGWIYSIYEASVNSLVKFNSVNIDNQKKNLLVEEILNNKIIPRSGFTDVGLHTGGQLRPTVYGIIKNVLYYLFMYIN